MKMNKPVLYKKIYLINKKTKGETYFSNFTKEALLDYCTRNKLKLSDYIIEMEDSDGNFTELK